MTSINSTNVVHEYFSPFNFSTHAGYTGTLHSEVDGNSYFTKQNTWKTKNSYVLAILNIQQPKCTASPLLLSLQFRCVYYMGDIPMQSVKQFVEIRHCSKAWLYPGLVSFSGLHLQLLSLAVWKAGCEGLGTRLTLDPSIKAWRGVWGALPQSRLFCFVTLRQKSASVHGPGVRVGVVFSPLASPPCLHPCGVSTEHLMYNIGWVEMEEDSCVGLASR